MGILYLKTDCGNSQAFYCVMAERFRISAMDVILLYVVLYIWLGGSFLINLMTGRRKQNWSIHNDILEQLVFEGEVCVVSAASSE